MSQENVEIVSRVFEAWDRADLNGMLDHFAPSFELQTSGRFADTDRVYRGHQGWTDFWNTLRAAWEQITVSIKRIEDRGGKVLVLGTFHARGRGSGVEVGGEAAWLVTVEGGLVAQARAFEEWSEALEAAGLSE